VPFKCNLRRYRPGRDEVVRQDALPFVVSRLVDDCKAAVRAAAAAAAAAANAEKQETNKKNKSDGNNNNKSNPSGHGGGGAEGMSAIQARLDRLGEEISAGTVAAEGASREATSSIHLDMLRAQRRRLLGELAGARQEQRTERAGARQSAGSAWSHVVGGTEVVCATLSGAGLLAADRTGRRAGGGFGAGKAAGGGFGTGCGGAKPTSAAADEVEAMMLAAGASVPLFDAVVIDEAGRCNFFL
jgi:hypothetical protein